MPRAFECQPKAARRRAARCPQSYRTDAAEEQTPLCAWREVNIRCQKPNHRVRSGTGQHNLCTSHLLSCFYSSADSSAHNACARGGSPKQKMTSPPTQTQGPELGRSCLHVEDRPDLTKFVCTEPRAEVEASPSKAVTQTQVPIQISFPPTTGKAPPISG